MQIYVVGKQWMWKLQHMEGQREINELHVPGGPAHPPDHDLRRRDPQLLCARVPHQAGRGAGPLYHHLVQAHQGRQVSSLLRRILRHQPLRHDRLGLRDGAAGLPGVAERRRRQGSLAESGQKLFDDLACANCHKPDGSGRCPSLVGSSAARCSWPAAES